MDSSLIENWNKIIDPQDLVFHLGDLTLGGVGQAEYYLSRLNGDIRVLSNPWHHDKRWLGGHYISKSGFTVQFLSPMVVLEIPELGKEGRPLAISLCHYPLAEWDRKHYGAWHLHGHSHGNHKGEGYILDVGVDSMNFHPIKLSNVLGLMYERGYV
jgi:calcineurin-like phosphoesterase family protein